jgi:hypothetical protein
MENGQANPAVITVEQIAGAYGTRTRGARSSLQQANVTGRALPAIGPQKASRCLSERARMACNPRGYLMARHPDEPSVEIFVRPERP